MTLDEAIIHAEEAAKRNEEYAKIHAHGDEFEQEDAFKCENCAKEHKQIAEWLKEYKRLLEQEPCEDAISRQAVLDINEHHHGQMPNHVNHEIWKEIKALPSVTPQPKMGRWILRNAFLVPYKCSECNYESESYDNYCPNCGANMWEVDNEKA